MAVAGIYRELKRHPASPCKPVRTIAAHVSRGALLSLRYTVEGDILHVRRQPRPEALWKSTCFEAFLRTPGTEAYLEFNFAPSRLWAAFRFTRYREGKRDSAIAAPALRATSNNSELILKAELDLENVAELPRCSIWQLGLSAVIEETNGRISYWALRHPPGKPDFHHPDCFTLELPPP